MEDVEQILHCENKLGEGPIWDPLGEQLYWVDIGRANIWRWRVGKQEPECFSPGQLVGCLGLTSEKVLITATGEGFASWNPGSGVLEPVHTPAEKDPDLRFNDGMVGPDGGFWAGTLSEDPVNHLYRLDPDGTSKVMESGIRISNGIGWSPDRALMYYTDSLARCIYVYDFDLPSASIANRRIFVNTEGEAGVPDGLVVDSAGCVWSARWDGWKICRYDPDGTLMGEIPMPVQRPTSCTFGGADLSELYITSAWIDLTEEERSRQPFAGDLFRLQTDIKGQPENYFG